MENSLTVNDFEIILESLKYSKKQFEDYEFYPSLEFKNQRIQEIEEVIKKVKEIVSNKANY